ncbi:MAG: hypothetical protein HFE86_08050 [Clostridiales bacterium]|nr:hypothetical protein [Clostridiales bacterium]
MRHKNNAFGNDLVKCADFPLQQAQSLTAGGKDGDAVALAALHRQSALHYAAFCDKADRAFVTPIDRRDLLELAAAFHRLTGRLAPLPISLDKAHHDRLTSMCRALKEAVSLWRPLGAKTAAPLLPLRRAGAEAQAGLEAAARERETLLQRAAPVWQRLDALFRIEAAFRCGDETADLIRRVRIQNE